MAPVRHLIRGRIITESSGTSPPGDPMDKSDEESQTSPENGRTQELPVESLGSLGSLVASTSKSPEETPRRQFACKSVKMTVFPSDSQKSDTEEDFQPEEHDSLSHSEESHITESSSARTSVDKSRGKDPTAMELLKLFGERTCDCCHRLYNPRRARYFRRFCRNRCARLFVEEAVSKKPKNTRRIPAVAYKNRRNFRNSTPLSESYSEHTSITSGAPSRKSARLRRRPFALCDTDVDESSSSNESSKGRQGKEGSSKGSSKGKAGKEESSKESFQGSSQGKVIRLIKIEPNVSSYRPSPEIPCTTLPSTSARGKNSVPKRAASNRASQLESGEVVQKRPRLNSRYLSPQARQFINEKSDYVKTLIMEKPVVAWDFSEVAAFAESLGGGGGLATVILTAQVDGQCLLLIDDAETWQNGFGLSGAKAKKIVREVQMLEFVQRESTLKEWYEDRPRQFSAAVKYLENSTKI